MTILLYGEKASRTHENQMLRALLDSLADRWATSTDWIYVIANSMWNGAEIDLVCVLPSAIIVADFKSYHGRLTGTENGPWQADGVLVKGGRKANPYQQLRDNKFSVMDWLQSKGSLSGRNLGHISAGVVFSGPIENQLDLPPKVRSWFYPTDLVNCAALLDGLASPELRIEQDEAREIVLKLGVTPIEWASNRPKVQDLEPRRELIDSPDRLTEHQRDVAQSLRIFTASETSKTFAVLGMTSTGKSRLLAELIDDIKQSGRSVIVLTPNRRLANSSVIQADSIYAHLYKGNTDTDTDNPNEPTKTIPLRECGDTQDCVYLLDDAHLLGNSRFSTPDGKQYGSGRLLADLFDFIALESTQRKVIFFGDPYQIQRAGAEDSILSGAFQKSRKLNFQSARLTQLIDVTAGSAKLVNATKLVAAIDTQRFAELEMATDDNFKIVDKKEAANALLTHFRSDPHSVWCLAETHVQVNGVTHWLRSRLLEKKSLRTLEAGDLLEIYVRAGAQGSFDSSSASVSSGERLIVANVGNYDAYNQALSWVKNGPVRFHSIGCEFQGQEGATFHIFYEFLTAEKPELDKETAIAERAWREENKRKIEKTQEARLPGIDPLIPPPPAPDFTYARYGYASTVHHAQGMAQPTCYVNCDHSAGRHSEGFFRWLYSALTVAESELVIFNLPGIHAFDDADWKAGAVKAAPDIAVGAGWSFQADGNASERDQQRSPPVGLNESKDLLKSAAIWLRVVKAAERLGWHIVKAASYPYQEQYDLVGPQGEQCLMRVAYNGKNVVTAMHLKDPEYWPLLTAVAFECLATNGYSMEAEALLRSAKARIAKGEWQIVSATETAYRLLVTVVRKQEERVSLEINFDKQGLATSLRPLQASDLQLLPILKELLL